MPGYQEKERREEVGGESMGESGKKRKERINGGE